MSTLIVIPARYGSSRLPGKPLLAQTGKYLIQHTYEQAARSIADRVVVATDDRWIEAAVKSFGGEVVMTSPDHETGTTRVAEVAHQTDAEIIVNLQGDEPEIDPRSIDRLIECHRRADVFASTLACRFSASAKSGAGSPDDPAAVKVLVGVARGGAENGGDGPAHLRGHYFTRSIVPWPRLENGEIANPEKHYLHMGIYAFSARSLQRFATAPPGVLEASARLEQLRILEMGEEIAIAIVDGAAPGIDTPADYTAFVARCPAHH